MTDASELPTAAPDAVTLPLLVHVNQSFTTRLPSQRVLDMLAKIEGVDFGELATSSPFRIIAFRVLLRDFPNYDPTALWMHAYDTEVEVEPENPTNGSSPIPEPVSATTGT